VTIAPNKVTQAPVLVLEHHQPAPLPNPLLPTTNLSQTANYTATALFPPDSVAQVQAFQFEHAGAIVDTLRLYLPLGLTPGQRLPLFFVIYPGIIDGWEPVSVAFASQGLGMVAISPIAARAVDIGGSFTSAVLHRLLRDEGQQIAAWVTVGGISNAFSGTADFYAGDLIIPPEYEFLIPALGRPNLHPLNFLRYSPIYTAQQLPPTLIIHTDADRIIPISQAYELEKALHLADVPPEVFYYQDVSHYLQIGENMSAAGEEMFYRVVDFTQRYGAIN